MLAAFQRAARFQHTAARRRLVPHVSRLKVGAKVSTHSRPKAAGFEFGFCGKSVAVSTHSRPKAAGTISTLNVDIGDVSTHSRPKAAGGL